MGNGELVFLLVEDSEHDVLAIKKAWQENRIANELHIVHDGQECLDYLNQRGAFSGPETAPQPDVILLNNKLPRMNGMQVLKKSRERDGFGHLPVIMLTANESEAEQCRSYNLGVNAYIVKPMGFKNLSETIRKLNKFWNLVEIPQEC